MSFRSRFSKQQNGQRLGARPPKVRRVHPSWERLRRGGSYLFLRQRWWAIPSFLTR